MGRQSSEADANASRNMLAKKDLKDLREAGGWSTGGRFERIGAPLGEPL
jgi:hypothetical protein